MSPSPCHVSQFSPEFQLACLCCRPALTKEDGEEIGSFLRRIDVPTFLELVISRHRIGPLVYAELRRRNPAELPEGLMGPLSQEARANAIRALGQRRTLIMLARWFGAQGIDWMVFKGPAVAQRHYYDVSLRHVNDLDVWVPPEKLLQARKVLSERGFRLDEQARHWDIAARGRRHLDFLLNYYFEEQHDSAEFGPLELHWQLTGNLAQFSIDPQQMMERGREILLGEARVVTMPAEDELLYLCEHGGRHGWYRLKWLADLPRVLESTDWNWKAVFQRARLAGSHKTLLLGLALCRDLFAWPCPAAVADEVAGFRSLAPIAKTVATGLKAPGEIFGRTSQLPFSWRIQDSARAVLLSGGLPAVRSHLYRRMLSPKDLKVLALPDRFFWLYFFLRPALLVTRQLRA